MLVVCWGIGQHPGQPEASGLHVGACMSVRAAQALRPACPGAGAGQLCKGVEESRGPGSLWADFVLCSLSFSRS